MSVFKITSTSLPFYFILQQPKEDPYSWENFKKNVEKFSQSGAYASQTNFELWVAAKGEGFFTIEDHRRKEREMLKKKEERKKERHDKSERDRKRRKHTSN